MTQPRLAIVVLAAGSSSRMGYPKQLIKFEGQTLIRRTVVTATASLADCVFVTTADNGVNFGLELHGLQWRRVAVANPQLGQSESVRTGIIAVEAQNGFNAVLLTPCDLPLLSVSHLNALIDKYRSGAWSIVASRYGKVLGAPLIVGRELWPELHALQGDVGVRKIIPNHLRATAVVDWEEGEFDLDTPDDVDRATNNRRDNLRSDLRKE